MRGDVFMIVNHIFAASRIPLILEKKGIDIGENLLTVDIDKTRVRVHITGVENAMKFDGWVFNAYEEPTSYGTVGQICAEFEGVEFFTLVKTEMLPLIEN